MSIEAMKQALEALETPWMSYTENGCDIALGKRMKAINALRQAIKQAEKQAPVAWPLDNQHAERIAERHCVSYEVVQLIAREILTTPQPQQAEKQKPVNWKRLYELEKKKKEAIYEKYERDIAKLPRIIPMEATPKPEWVGLTDDEIDNTEWIPRRGSQITYDIGWLDNMKLFARAIEAKLKEKNG